jgi:UDP-glucose 4-epimerase
MSILVTGGAGYIGSFMVKRLLDDGYQVTVIDSLERGNKEVVDHRANLQVGNLLDTSFVDKVLKQQHYDAVIHFAGYIAVGESMQHPDEYFRNNTFGSFVLLEQMRQHNINNVIFSSTAGVYGNPQQVPIPESHPKNPESPYGESKLLVENGLGWYNQVFGINSIMLRYFNAAGAALDGSMGEEHTIESHIIPNIIKAVLSNTPFPLFGNDYPTEDGTCVRDYIHVLDLVEAHLLALKKLQTSSGSFIYNVGTGMGFSNKQVISMVEKVAGKNIELVIEKRRPGDAAILVADNSKIKQELGFSPKYSDLELIVRSAWKWHSSSKFKK